LVFKYIQYLNTPQHCLKCWVVVIKAACFHQFYRYYSKT